MSRTGRIGLLGLHELDHGLFDTDQRVVTPIIPGSGHLSASGPSQPALTRWIQAYSLSRRSPTDGYPSETLRPR